MRLIEPKTLQKKFPPSRRYLIGVSGGRDSVALLHSLVDLGYKNLIVCHLDHQLRGRSSAADARFVEKLAAKYDVDLALGSTDVRALAAKRKCRSNRPRVKRVTNFSRKWRNGGDVAPSFSLTTLTTSSRLS